MTNSKILNNDAFIRIDEDTQLYWANDRENALFVADISSILREMEDIFIIGGEKMYELFDALVNRVYLTEVFDSFQGDAFFNKQFKMPEWKCLVEEDYSRNYNGDDFPHRFTILERRERRHRYQYLTQFYTEQAGKAEWIKCNVKLPQKKISEYIQAHLDL